MLNFSSRHDFLTSNQFQLVHFGILISQKLIDTMTKPCTLFINIKICNMQPIQWLFWLFWSFKNGFLWILNDPAWPGTLATCSKTLSTITICNTKSIQQAKHLKMAENLIFGSMDHSKMHFRGAWMILHELVTLSKNYLYYHYMQYQVDPTMQTPENGEKPHFWLYGSFKNAFPWCLNDPSWPENIAEC